MTEKEALYKYCLRLGDDALMQSYRLSEWCSNAPLLEEDLALTNMALDMTGRAQLLLDYAAQNEGKGRTHDDLAYRREEHEYYNHLLAELPNTDFAFSMMRQFFLSAYEYLFYTALALSKDATLAAIAAKTVKEVKYHLAHSRDWVIRLGDGTEESHDRMQQAANDLWAYTYELFEKDIAEDLLVTAQIAVDAPAIEAGWKELMDATFAKATLALPEDKYLQNGGRQGVHTEHMGHILTEMQYLQRTYPDAIW